MGAVTYYVAMPFLRRFDGGTVVSGDPVECSDATLARWKAAWLAAHPPHCGAVAFAQTGLA